MNRSRGVSAVTLALACAGIVACADPETEDAVLTLGVAAAPSLSGALTEMIEVFEDEHPGVRVSLELGRSDTIAEGMPDRDDINVFASADEVSMQRLVDDGVAVEPTVFARNHVVVAVPSGNPRQVRGLRDLERPGLRVGLCALDVPCGRAADSLLAAAGVTPPEVDRDDGSRALTARLADSEVDVGIVYRTDVAAAGERVLGIEIPDAVNVTTDYPILAVSDHELAAVFVEEVLSERGQRHLTDAGFVAP